MKKITLILFALFTCWQINAQVAYTYDWEPTGLGGWTTAGTGTFARNTTTPCLGAASARANVYYDGTNTFTSPLLGVSNGGVITFAFDYKVTEYSSNTTGAPANTVEIIVQRSSSTSGPWTTVETINSSNHIVSSSCATKTVTFSQEIGNLYVRFLSKAVGASSDLYFRYDNIVVSQGAAPSCLAPTTLAASNVTSSSVDLSWVASSGTQTDFEYFIQAAGAGIPSLAGTPISASSVIGQTLDFNGVALLANTSYEFYVRANCGAEYSSWSGPVSFRTACNAFTVPFTEGFNSTSSTEACWNILNVNADADAWSTNYATNPFEGDQAAMMYTDGNGGVNNDWLISPTITLTGNQRLKFQYRVQSATEPNDFELLLSTTGNTPASFTNVLMATASYNNITYVERIVDLSAYSGNANIAWHIPNGGLDGWRLYIDNVIVEDIPSCVEPNSIIASNITSSSVDLSWTDGSGGLQLNYQYVIQAPGTGVPTGAGTQVNNVSVIGQSVDVNGNALTENTSYEVYVRADCGADFSTWIGPITFRTACDPFGDFQENFDSLTVTGSIPDCWSVLLSGTGLSTFATVGMSTTNYSAPNSISLYNSSSPNTSNIMLVSPIINNLSDGTNRLRFFARNSSATQDLEIGTMSDPMDASTFTVLETVDINGTWAEYTVSFASYTGTDTYFAFRRLSTSTYTYVYLDNVVWEPIPSCVEPNTILASNVTSSTVDLSWTDGSGGLQFDYEYVIQAPATGEPTGAGAQIGDVTVVGEGFDIDGNPLTPNTSYEVYVRADCGGGDYSAWSGPITFRTTCEAITVFPHTEDFEADNPCWTNLQVSGVDNWVRDAAGGSGDISAAHGGTGFMEKNYNSSEALLFSPAFDFTALGTDGRVRVWLHRHGSADVNDEYTVYVNTSKSLTGATQLLNLYSLTTVSPAVSSTGWYEYVMNIPSSFNSSNNVYIIFQGLTSAGFSSYDLGVDDFVLEALPSCVEPNTILVSNVTSSTVDLSWTDGSGGLQFDYEYAIQAPGTGIPATAGAQVGDVTVVGEGFDINGDPLAANTTYEVYVRADCGGGDFSPWIGPITFTTLCNTFVAPYTEDFENAGAIPSCWNMSGSENWLFSNAPGFNHIGNNGVITGSTTSGGYFAWVDDSSPNTTNATLTSPMIDVSALAVPRLTFFELSNNEGNTNSTLNVEVWDGAAWNAMATYNTNTSGWEKRIIDLSSLTITGDIQVRFIIAESPDFYDDIAIDDVTIEETPSCLEPTLFSVDTVGTDSVTVSWTAGATETEWEYVIQAQGTGVPAGAGISVTTNPLTISGLTPNTPYEIYLRAVCSVTEQSIWVGPFAIMTSTEVICGTPVNTTYCYTDNDTTTWTFTSNDGSPLRVVFNAGEMESCCDDILIYDGTDNTGTLLYQGNNGGDLTGLTFDSLSDSIYIEIDSDGSVNCGDEGYVSMDFDVVCATCVNPTATYSIVPDCANAQYSIEVDVTNIGSATSLTISDGTTTLTAIAATGVQTFGPYADGANTTITITNEQDGACSVTSGVLTNVCPPSNDDCANAIAVDCNDVVTGSTTGATDSGNNSSADVWYSYSGAAGDITVSLCNNTAYDSYLRVFDACGGTEIAFNDDFCGAQSQLTFTADGVTTYYIMVEGFSSNVGDFEMAVTCVLSNGDFNANSFSAYPNPVKDVLNISYATEISSVTVINMIGQEVLSKNINATSSQVDMSQLSAGTYIVNVTLGDTIKTLKVVKQ